LKKVKTAGLRPATLQLSGRKNKQRTFLGEGHILSVRI